MARASWLFPELGQVDASQPATARLKQLAALMTDPENGRFTRTLVNRLWQRLMGRGIVHPADAMQTEPWSADLLDWLATNLADNRYDLKKTLELICTSQAYQSQAQVVEKGADDHGYVYAGPRARRLTAEQFVDAVWQITGTAPAQPEASVKRGRTDAAALAHLKLAGRWVWSSDGKALPKAGAAITLRKRFELKEAPAQAGAAITCDNSYALYVNGKKVQSDDNWETVESVVLDSHLQKGSNEFLVVARNGGAEPNPAGLWFEARIRLPDGSEQAVPSDETWEWTAALPDEQGRFLAPPAEWRAAVPVAETGGWNERLGNGLATAVAAAAYSPRLMVRASLMRSDLLMRALGRPNREQIVSLRPSDLTTLEALDLNNGQILATRLEQGGRNLAEKNPGSTEAFARWLYAFALSRAPVGPEMALAREALGEHSTPQGVQDFLWAVFLLPEFQYVR